MHHKVKQAIEEIDAALFNGDTFSDPEALAYLEHTLIRWMWEASTNEGTIFKTTKFGDLQINERFILLPQNGGWTTESHEFMLWQKTTPELAARTKIDQLSKFPSDVNVIKVVP